MPWDVKRSWKSSYSRDRSQITKPQPSTADADAEDPHVKYTVFDRPYERWQHEKERSQVPEIVRMKAGNMRRSLHKSPTPRLAGQGLLWRCVMHSMVGTWPLSHMPGSHCEHSPTRVQGITALLRNWCSKPRACVNNGVVSTQTLAQ